MFSESAEYYDLIYTWKDYRSEAQTLRTLIQRYHPNAATILDIACGTAEHLRYLSEYRTEGIDLNPRFVELARRKLPSVPFQVADMRRFRLERKFDVIICLFSSIGYLLDDEDIRSAFGCFREHLATKGVLFIEPWFEPDVWNSGHVSMCVGEKDDLKVCRIMTSDRSGDRSLVLAHHLVAAKTEYFVERQELRLLTRKDLIRLFEQSGFKAEYHEEGITSRGLYVARAAT